MTHPELEQHATLYLEPLGAAIVNRLGAGTDGSVWQTTRHATVKGFLKEKNFDLELECYRRLQTAALIAVFGYWPGNIMSENWDPEL